MADLPGAFDIDKARAEALAAAHSMQDCSVTPASSIPAAIAGVDICITCTTSKSPVLTEDMDLKGCFVAAVGAVSAAPRRRSKDRDRHSPDVKAPALIIIAELEARAAELTSMIKMAIKSRYRLRRR